MLIKLVFAIFLLFDGYSADETDDSPLHQLANVVRFFPTAELCSKNCDATTWYDDDGSLKIGFATKIADDENQG